MLDVDFVPAAPLRVPPSLHRLILAGSASLVVPAFEFSRGRKGRLPRDKTELESLVRAGRMEMFHRSWPPGHNSTDYGRWLDTSPGEVYTVREYQSAYEPYIIFARDAVPWCVPLSVTTNYGI